MELVGAERGDHHQPLVTGIAGQEGEQVAQLSAVQVEVLHDEQDRGGLAQAAEEPQDALEDTDLQPVGVAGRHGCLATDARQLWNKPRELGEAGAGGIGDAGGVDVVDQRA